MREVEINSIKMEMNIRHLNDNIEESFHRTNELDSFQDDGDCGHLHHPDSANNTLTTIEITPNLIEPLSDSK
jgi:hypothetical protein